ncbi:hypothetical protein [Glutamicibacter sp. AOP5-A2-18]|uniref:hypothetical protein n=1 Tax=Glutamicibacter sp. AOP5-A2-18 TaxID=3457656 RepID=UPI004034BE88
MGTTENTNNESASTESEQRNQHGQDVQELTQQLASLTREMQDLKRRRSPWIIRAAQGVKQRVRTVGQSWMERSVPTGQADAEAVKQYPSWIQKLVATTRGKTILAISAVLVLAGYCFLMFGLVR